MFTKNPNQVLKIILPAVLIIALALPLFAAQDPTGSDQAGVLEREFRERKERKKIEEIELPQIESKLPEEEASGLPDTEFFVSKIIISGNTIFPKQQIEVLKTKFENKTSSLKELKELALDITAYYRQRGYVTSRAIIPPQKMIHDEVTIQIVEGKVGEVKIEGLKYTREGLIRKRFNVKPGEILRYQVIERYLANLNINPDRVVKIVLLPGTKPETTDIVLKVEEKLPMHASYGFSNLGTVSTGPLRESVSASFTNLLGWDDQLTSRLEISERRDFIGISTSYLLPLDSRGDLLSFDFSRAEVELGKDLKPLGATGNALVFGPTLILPFLQTRYLSGEWNMGFDFKRIRTMLQGIAISKDDLRVFKFGPNFIENDKWGKTILNNGFQCAFAGAFGGLHHNDIVSSRREVDGGFWQYNVTFGRLQNLWNGIQGVVRVSAQFTPHRLAPAQQFRLGGFDTVRGYPEGSYLGDYGYQSSFELRLPLYLIPKEWTWPSTQLKIRDSIRGVVFVDTGKGYLSSPFEEEEKSQRLTGIGGGFRITISRNLQARIDWGIPVASRSPEGRATRLHFSLQAGF